MECFKKELKIAEDIKYINGQAHALAHIADVYEELNEFALAKEYFERQKFLIQQINHRRAEGTCLWRISRCEAYLHNVDAAITAGKEALNIYDSLNDERAKDVSRDLKSWQRYSLVYKVLNKIKKLIKIDNTGY